MPLKLFLFLYIWLNSAWVTATSTCKFDSSESIMSRRADILLRFSKVKFQWIHGEVRRMKKNYQQQMQTSDYECCWDAEWSILTTTPSDNPKGHLLSVTYKALRVIALLWLQIYHLVFEVIDWESLINYTFSFLIGSI